MAKVTIEADPEMAGRAADGRVRRRAKKGLESMLALVNGAAKKRMRRKKTVGKSLGNVPSHVGASDE